MGQQLVDIHYSATLYGILTGWAEAARRGWPLSSSGASLQEGTAMAGKPGGARSGRRGVGTLRPLPWTGRGAWGTVGRGACNKSSTN